MVEEKKISRRKSLKYLGTGIVAVGAAAAGAGYYYTSTGPKVQEVTIGVVFPLTGAAARLGATTVEGIKLAVEDVNAEGGIKSLGGAKLKLVTADTKSDPKVAVSEGERLITTANPTVILGCFRGGETLAFSEVTERYNVPILTGSVPDALTERGYKYIFQPPTKAKQIGITMVDLSLELGAKYGKPPKKIAAIFERTAYGEPVGDGIKKRAEEKGLDIRLWEGFVQPMTDFTPLVTKLKNSGATILFGVAAIADAILLTNTMKELGVKMTIFGGGSGYLLPDWVKATGDISENAYSISMWQPDMKIPGIAELNDRFVKRTGEAFMPEQAGENYAMIWLIKEALEKAASTDPKKVRDAIAAADLKLPHRAAWLGSGAIAFDSAGLNKYNIMVVVQIQKGKHVTVYPEAVASGKPIWPVPGVPTD